MSNFVHQLRPISQIPASSSRVILRLDLNVPVAETGEVADLFRIQAILPTIKALIDAKKQLVILSHLGRPTGPDPKLSLRSVAAALATQLNLSFQVYPEVTAEASIVFYPDSITHPDSVQHIQTLMAEHIVILENSRFDAGEEQLHPALAAVYAQLGDVYVNDAFSVCHHAATTVTLLPTLLPSYAGPRLLTELNELSRVESAPHLVAMIGGVKISDKAETISALAKSADQILLGGGLANLFLLASGLNIGQSVCEQSALPLATQLLRQFKSKLLLPRDVIVTSPTQTQPRVVPFYEVGPDDCIYDLGPATILQYAQVLQTAENILWNGPLGLFERRPFHHTTFALAQVVAGLSAGQAYTIIGGGDTIAAFTTAKYLNDINFVSTGGGAMLAYLAGQDLPGLRALIPHST